MSSIDPNRISDAGGHSSPLSKILIASPGREPFCLGPLPYSKAALEPVLDRDTVGLHYEVHHRTCVERLNEALCDDSVHGMTLGEILSRVSHYSKAVRDNGGGHWNHSFLWSVMTDTKENHEMSSSLLRSIERNFGSFERFKFEFIRIGSEHMGSGWLWLMQTPTGALQLATTLNHDNPLMDVCDVKGTPLLTCDLWEHAYCLSYKAKREDYLRKFLAIVNWAHVGDLLEGRTSAATSCRH